MVLRCCLVALSVMSFAGSLCAVEEEPPKPFPQMSQFIGEMVNRFYYDQKRVNPTLMLEHSMRELEENEISFRAEISDGSLRLEGLGKTTTLSLPKLQSLKDLAVVYDSIREVFPELGFDVNRSRDLTYVMLNGALATLDPHTVLMPPKRAKEFSESISGQFYGVGAYLNQDVGDVRIERVMKGMPAEKAGLKDGDKIIAVDGEPTVGLTLSQVVDRIRGPLNTIVNLKVEREGSQEPLEIPTSRGVIAPPTLISWQKDQIGYVRLDQFNRYSNQQLDEAISQLQEERPLRGFVLDLRFNGGGLLPQAHMIADMFLGHSKEVVRTVSMIRSPQILQSGRRLVLPEVPIVVLVGPSSASASEILSGALQQNDRAIVAGNTTYGKGSVQTMRPLLDDSIFKFTIQEYQLKDGLSIQGQGVDPDLALLRRMIDEEGQVDLFPYSPSSEADLEFALHSHNVKDKEDPSLSLAWVAEHQDEDAIRRTRMSARDFHPDQEASLVIDLLKHAVEQDGVENKLKTAWKADDMRSATIELLRGAVAEQAQKESAVLGEALEKMDKPIAWGKAGPEAKDVIQVEYLGPHELVPGEETALRFKVQNSGENDVGQLYGIVRADEGSPFWESELIIGSVSAGGEREVAIPFTIPPRIYGGNEQFILEVHQDGIKDIILELPVQVNVAVSKRPHFSVSWTVLNENNVEDQIVLDQPRFLRLEVLNDGPGPSLPLDLSVFKDDDPYVSLTKGSFQLESIPAGGKTAVMVPFTVRSKPLNNKEGQGTPADITFQLSGVEDIETGIDGRFRERFFHDVNLTISNAAGVIDYQKGQVIKPSIQLKNLGQKEGAAELGIRLEDDNIRYLAVFVNDVKTQLETFADEAIEQDITLPIKIDAGLNEIRLIATDADDVISVLPLRVWVSASQDLAEVAP